MTHSPVKVVPGRGDDAGGFGHAATRGSSGDGDGAGLRGVTEARPSACGREWLMYVMAPIAHMTPRTATAAAAFQTVARLTPSVRRRAAGGSVRESRARARALRRRARRRRARGT